MEVKAVKSLFKNTARVIRHHKQLTEARGEYYNMFSVFKIETRENKTHSAFLADLINPKGAHRQGTVFLDLFKEVLKNAGNEIEKKPFDFSKRTRVRVEKDIGPKSKDKLTGGRIDIYLKDAKGNSISIENKIHAGEQELQVARYCNHNEKRNTVYYLTLDGKEPSPYSKGNKKLGIDYHLLSYKYDITNWLQLCLKEVPNFTALRETINQYILLIKKLTFTMQNEQQKELNDLISDNIEEAQFIAQNYEGFIQKVKTVFRADLKNKLMETLDQTRYLITLGNSPDKTYSQIWIELKNPNENKPDIYFGVESFSGGGHNNGNLFVGVFNDDKSKIGDSLDDYNLIHKYWKQTEPIVSEEFNPINLSSTYWLKVIAKPDSKEYQRLLEKSTKTITDFIQMYESQLL